MNEQEENRTNGNGAETDFDGVKLMIAIPALDMVQTEFMRNLIELVECLHRDGIEHTVRIQCATLVYKSRDALAAEAVNDGYTHVLWLDSDMVFPKDTVQRMLRTKKAFVTGVYNSRHSPFLSCVFLGLDPLERPARYPKEPFPVTACGFGIVMTETSVIRDVYEKHGCMFHPTEGYGEDIAFCMRAKDAGHTLWCEPGIRAGHIAHVTVFPDMNNEQ